MKGLPERLKDLGNSSDFLCQIRRISRGRLEGLAVLHQLFGEVEGCAHGANNFGHDDRRLER